MSQSPNHLTTHLAGPTGPQVGDVGHRARKILQAVVSEFLSSGDPVGSRTVTRRHDLGLSPATVRNVMADLEDLGLLQQRHTSGGRVPTSTGLRYFIDSLLKVRGLTGPEKDAIRARIVGASPEDVLRNASRLLSDLTQHAAVIVAPDPANQRFGHIEFVPLRGGKLLAILVGTDGRVENRVLTVETPVEPHRLERIHDFLNQTLVGLTLEEARERVLRELGDVKATLDREVAQALTLGQAALAAAGPADVVVSGQSNLIDPGPVEASSAGRMRDLLRTLEDKQLLARLLDRTRGAEGIQVFLGAETDLAALTGSSVVAIPYAQGEHALGALAVIGPMRMNYGKVISVVDFTAAVVSELLDEL